MNAKSRRRRAARRDAHLATARVKRSQEQRVGLALAPAPISRRVVASAIDLSVSGVVLYAVTVIIEAGRGRPRMTNVATTPYWLALLAVTATWLAYSSVAEGGAHGQTLGKLVVGIKVGDATGRGPLGFRRALVRRSVQLGLLGALVAPALADAWRALADPEGRSWHDLAARAMVVRA